MIWGEVVKAAQAGNDWARRKINVEKASQDRINEEVFVAAAKEDPTMREEVARQRQHGQDPTGHRRD